MTSPLGSGSLESLSPAEREALLARLTPAQRQALMAQLGSGPVPAPKPVYSNQNPPPPAELAGTVPAPPGALSPLSQWLFGGMISDKSKSLTKPLQPGEQAPPPPWFGTDPAKMPPITLGGKSKLASFGQTAVQDNSPYPSDLTLDAIIEAMARQDTSGPNINDYLGQAKGLVRSSFAPQYGALDAAKKNLQGQYNTSDPIVAGLYQKLQADIQGQAAAQRAAAEQGAASQQTQGNDLAARIAASYKGVQDSLSGAMQANGTQAAASDVLSPLAGNSAWQQGNALQTSAAQGNFAKNRDTNQANWLQNVSNAAGTQGAVSREDLIRDLSEAFARVDTQRASLAGQESSAALSWADKLAQNASSTQGSELKNLLDLYELQSGKENTAWERAYKDAQLKGASAAGKEPKVNTATQIKASLLNAGIPQHIADDAVSIAVEAASGGAYSNGAESNPAMKDAPSFANHITKIMQQKYPGNKLAQQAANDAAYAYAELIKFKTTNSL